VCGTRRGERTRTRPQCFASQNDQFVGAIPPALSDLLKTSGINSERFETVSAASSRTRGSYRDSGDSVGATSVVSTSRGPVSSARWAYWVIPALALAGLLWYLLGGERMGEPVKGPQQAFRPTAQGPVVDTDLQRQITAALDSLNGTLQGLKDAASATQGLPGLRQAASELDRLSGAADRLPVETRERIAEAIKAAAARSRTTLDSVSAMPGVGADVTPVVAALRRKVDALALTPASIAQQRAGQAAERVIYLPRTPSGGVLASTYFNRDVHNRAGEKIGSISDLIVASDGTITAALVSVGSFLGIGQKEVAVPFSSIEVVRRDSDWHFVFDATKDALKDAPSYEDSAARLRLSPGPGTNR
jgi:sporulation protein YlmC with PRC-barrel domain